MRTSRTSREIVEAIERGVNGGESLGVWECGGVGEREIFLVTCHPSLVTSFVLQSDAVREKLEAIYARLYAHFGPQHWWPGESRWEVMVGAILTQNTSWLNVEKALTNLKQAGRLEPTQMRRTRVATLARLIRPSGYFNLKAKKLKALVEFLNERYGGDPARLVGDELSTQREELLGVYGIGPETADSILLYAADQPVFVIDAYTRRICARLGLAGEDASYEQLQRLFMDHLNVEARYFNEYHALLVALGKRICTKRAPRCDQCPLSDFCPKVGVDLTIGTIFPSPRGRGVRGEGDLSARRLQDVDSHERA